jgi:pyruvate dehydrogenase phosphatase
MHLATKSALHIGTAASVAYLYHQCSSQHATTTPSSSSSSSTATFHHILGKSSTEDEIYNQRKRLQQFSNATLASGLSMSSYPANRPTEDRATVARTTIEVDSALDMLAAADPTNANALDNLDKDEHLDIYCVFDGHGGYQVADYASEMLIPHLINALRDSHPSTATESTYVNTAANSHDRFQTSLTQTYQRVERDIVGLLKPSFEFGFGNVARVGACALVAVLKENELYVANAGDCMCVLGSRDDVQPENKTRPTRRKATTLSTEHNCKHDAEQQRLLESHPGETIAGLVRCKSPTSCYVKGHLQPTRSLGDLYLKYSEFRPGMDKNSALVPYTHKDPGRSRRVRSPFSPPYVLSRPEIQHVTLTAQDDYLILASDGLWDEMTPEEAVSHLYEWESKGLVTSVTEKRQSKEVVVAGNAGPLGNESVRSPSASEYLIQKALEHAALESGQSLEQVCKIPHGKRRHVHDDITVVVVELQNR